MSKQSSSSSASLFLARVVFLLGFLAVTGVTHVINRSKDHPNRTDRRHRARASSTPTPHYPMCPVVVCPEISSSCKTVEFLVMEFDDSRSGQVIRCKSCSYCLDFPSVPSRSRQRRDLLELILFAINPSASCPAVPDSCSDIRMTRTWLSGQSTVQRSVKHCPACFDRSSTTLHHRLSAEAPALTGSQ